MRALLPVLRDGHHKCVSEVGGFNAGEVLFGSLPSRTRSRSTMEALQYKQATVSSNSCNISFFILIPQFACYKGISRKERDDGYFSPGITARSGVLIIVEIELPIFPE